MRIKHVYILTVVLGILICGCDDAPQKNPSAKKIDKAMEAWAKTDNELMDFYKPAFAENYSSWERELNDISRASIESAYDGVEEAMSILGTIDSSGLSSKEKLSLDVARRFLEIKLEGKPYAFHECLINPVDGLQFRLFEDLSYSYNMEAKDDGDYFLAKIRAFPAKIGQLRSYLNACGEKGTLPPRILLEASYQQAKRLAETPPKEHPLYRGIARQLGNADPVMINELEATEYLINAERILRENIYPAYEDLLKIIEVLVENAGEEISVKRFEDGEKFYRYQFKKYLGYERDPSGLHDWGLAQMDSLQELYSLDALKEGPQLEAGERLRTRMASLDSARAYLRRMRRNAKGLMDSLPQTRLYLMEMPDWGMDYTQLWRYYSPSLDRARRGILLIDMSHPDYQGILTHRIQLYQFGNPGLHFFQSGNLDDDGLSDFSKWLRFYGNQEGWALFSGDLVVHTLGLLQEEPAAFAEYQQEKIKALGKLIVDTGIHMEDWTREEAIDYLVEKAKLSSRQAAMWVDDCIIYPGKNSTSWLGYLDLLALEKEAKQLMGGNFLLQDFHSKVLNLAHSPFKMTRSRLGTLLN